MKLPFALPNMAGDLKQEWVQKTSAGGHLTVEVDLTKTIRNISISPDCITKTDHETLARTLTALLNDALSEAEARACQKLLSAAKPYLPKG